MMKKINIYLFLACVFCFSACQFNGSGKRTVKPHAETVEITEEDDEMDEEFYEELLDAFCREHYDKNLPGHYVGNSIRVMGFSNKDTHTVEVRGKHSFKGVDMGVHQAGYDDRDFVATVTRSSRDKYYINFSRRLEPLGELGEVISVGPGEWKYTGDIPFEYSSH